ncbi:restriction endonuclease subunit S [Vibrio parahaemolyticus]|uniref:restriction endonuclease subunit S n=1 Tax=Vibrio parahaemolyticus TaxID=670 RepID=UPI002553A9E9|nr:restriction endonuclease subunit S [Vibrio parahaemolyticus]
MNWNAKRLDDLLAPSGKQRAGNQDLPVLSITMKHGLVDQAEKFKKRVASNNTSKYRIAFKNELVVGFPIDEGVLGFQVKYKAGIVSPAYDIWKLKDESNTHIPYLERYLRSPQARNLYASRMQGAVARRRSLTKIDFLNLEIPFPPLNDQIRIAYLLSKVERLIIQRKEHLQQLDDLLKSAFLEMFGDPVRNEKGWSIGSLNSYGSFKNGLNFGKGESGISVRYLGVGDFKAKAKLENIDELSFIELNELPSDDYFLKNGDLLFVRSNGNRELVGRCMAVYPANEKVTYSGFIIRYRLSTPDLQATYISHLFRSIAFRRIIFQGGQGANIQNINQKILTGLPIPVPPKELQTQFANIVEKVEALKSRYQKSLNDLESLHGAFSQQAFKGELDLSQVPLPENRQPEDEIDAAMPELEEQMADQSITIHLPESDLLPDALTDKEKRKDLFTFWLEDYCKKIGNTPFSASDFFSMAHTRITELHPDAEFEFNLDEYDQIKILVFEGLEQGRIKQTQNITGYEKDGKPIFGNFIEIKAGTTS